MRSTTTTTALRDMTPPQIDAILADLYGKINAAEQRVQYEIDSIHRWVDKSYHVGRTKTWRMTDSEALGAARALPSDTWRSGRTIGEELARYNEALSGYRAARNATEPYTNEYVRRGGWSRFFLVTGGHIHSSMHCSTCRPTTQFGWLPDLSGLTEADAVAAHGALLCTVCYPSAPVEWTNFYEEQEAAKKAASCAGSGSYLDQDKPHRKGFYSGNWGTCPECGDHVTLTSAWKLRKHAAKK